MNRIRRLAALLLTLSFLLSMLPGATLAASPSFGDTEGHWAESAVARWAEYGVLTGGEDGNFAPDRRSPVARWRRSWPSCWAMRPRPRTSSPTWTRQPGTPPISLCVCTWG